MNDKLKLFDFQWSPIFLNSLSSQIYTSFYMDGLSYFFWDRRCQFPNKLSCPHCFHFLVKTYHAFNDSTKGILWFCFTLEMKYKLFLFDFLHFNFVNIVVLLLTKNQKISSFKPSDFNFPTWYSHIRLVHFLLWCKKCSWQMLCGIC
jgi:hypothetical protein